MITAVKPDLKAASAKSISVGMLGQFWYPEQGGGLDRYFFELVKQFGLDNVNLDFFTSGKPPAAYHNARGYSIGSTDASLPKRLYSAYFCYKQYLQQSYDCVNFHFALYALPALQHIPKHIPIVTHFHGPWALESLAEGQSRLSAKIKMAIELLVLRRSSRFVVLSQAFADLLCKEYGVNPDIIDVVPMGVDLDRFQPRDKAAARKRLGWPADKFIVFTARRLVQRVGLRELVEAARGLSDDANVWIAIAGRGPEQANLERQITELQLSQKVALLGFISEEQLALSYAAADLTVMPSQTLEGFGCVIAESLACGTPVMVTPVGGMPEYVRPLDKHLVSDGRDAGAISRTLAYLIDHKDALPSRDRCRSYAEETFSWTRVSQRLQTIFAQAGQH